VQFQWPTFVNSKCQSIYLLISFKLQYDSDNVFCAIELKFKSFFFIFLLCIRAADVRVIS